MSSFTLRCFAVLVTLLASGCGAAPKGPEHFESEPDSQSADSRSTVSDFILKDVDGRSHALSDYLGEKVIVISFWATWCEPCKKEMIQLQELYAAHADKGLMVLSISMDEPETQGEVRPYVKQRGFTFPVLLDTESQVTSQFNPRRAAPFTLIINRKQKTVWTHESYVPGDEEKLEAAVLEALGKGAS